jgi:hypothetical protein
MSLKDLLEKAFEPLRGFADRIDAQMEKRSLQPALAAPAGTATFKRATTSTLSLTAAAPPPPAAPKAAARSAPKAARPAILPAPRRAQPPPRPAAPPVPTVQIEGPAGEFFRLPEITPFTAQITTQSPETGSAIARMAATLHVDSAGNVAVCGAGGKPYLAGKAVTTESDGRGVTLTVAYNQTGQAGQGTLFVGFTDGRLTYLSGSGTGRDDAGRTVVRDIAAIKAGTAATTTNSRSTSRGSSQGRT